MTRFAMNASLRTVLVSCAGLQSHAAAQDFPVRPVEPIIGFAPGSASD
jgi:tripartite-type tricarboxylate transporter receptor subunit TctC